VALAVAEAWGVARSWRWAGARAAGVAGTAPWVVLARVVVGVLAQVRLGGPGPPARGRRGAGRVRHGPGVGPTAVVP
jgi:hypothetical protein